MSRSRKKHPIVKYGGNSYYGKRYASRKFRYYKGDLPLKGCFYKRLSNPYDIYDCVDVGMRIPQRLKQYREIVRRLRKNIDSFTKEELDWLFETIETWECFKIERLEYLANAIWYISK